MQTQPTPKLSASPVFSQTTSSVECQQQNQNLFDQSGDNPSEQDLIDANDQAKKALSENAPTDQLQDKLQNRKRKLLQAIKKDPAKALKIISQEASLSAAQTKNCLEEKATVEGSLEVLHVDDRKSFKDQTIYSIKVGDDRLFLVPSKKLKQALKSKTKIKISGYKLDNLVLFNTDQNNQALTIQASQAPGPDTQGDQKTLAVLVNFNNTTALSVTSGQVQDILFNKVNNYYQEVSFGKVSLSGEVKDLITLPIPNNCDLYGIRDQVISQIDPQVDFSSYHRLVIIQPYNPSCPAGGWGTIGKVDVTTGEGTVSLSTAWDVADYFDFSIAAHEYGHNFGMSHASFLDCTKLTNSSDCNYQEYGDIYDVMGSSEGQLNAPHKAELGWLGNKIQTISSSGTYTLGTFEDGSSSTEALEIPRSSYENLFLEYRQPIGADNNLASFGSNIFNGLLIHTQYSSGNTFLLDPTPPGMPSNITPALLPGETFTDPLTKTQIKLLSVSPSGAQVSITLGRSDFTAPELSITAPADYANVAGPIKIQANAQDPSGIKEVDFALTDGFTYKDLGSDKTAPYEVSVDTTKYNNGFWSIYVTAYDKAGDTYGGDNNFNWTFSTININNQGPDKTVPVVNITSPGTGASFKNPIVITADAFDNIGVSKVEFYKDKDSKPFSTSTGAPYQSSPITLVPGPHTLSAKATDTSGNVSTKQTISINVLDTSPPTIAITSPKTGDKVSTLSTIKTAVTDDKGVVKVEFYLNGALLATDTRGSTFSFTWNTSKLALGSYTLTAKAYDGAGNSVTSTPITVTAGKK